MLLLAKVLLRQSVSALAHTLIIVVPVYHLKQKPAGGVPVGKKEEKCAKELS